MVLHSTGKEVSSSTRKKHRFWQAGAQPGDISDPYRSTAKSAEPHIQHNKSCRSLWHIAQFIQQTATKAYVEPHI
eukprot:1156985-Pelagomonas_calceolata.AAC.3